MPTIFDNWKGSPLKANALLDISEEIAGKDEDGFRETGGCSEESRFTCP